jgi:hypothetical protein
MPKVSMPQRTVSVNVGQKDILTLASKVIGAPGASVNRMIEAALRVYRNPDFRDEIARQVSKPERRASPGGGYKYARVDENLVDGIDNISRAGRIGLALLMYEDMTLDEAIEWEAGRVPRGRPRKENSS